MNMSGEITAGALRPSYVFFCYRKPRERRSIRQWLRTFRRNPNVAWASFLAGWIFSASQRSSLCHVAWGDTANGVVINPGFEGNTLWPLRFFAMAYPNIDCCITVQVQGHIDLDQYPLREPRRSWPTIIRWLLMGCTPADNCVTLVSDILRQGGVNVPKRLQTPIALHDWLVKHHGIKTAFRDTAEPVA